MGRSTVPETSRGMPAEARPEPTLALTLPDSSFFAETLTLPSPESTPEAIFNWVKR